MVDVVIAEVPFFGITDVLFFIIMLQTKIFSGAWE